MTLSDIANKYYEYKDILERIENGDYDLYKEEHWEGETIKVPYTVAQIEGMREIVNILEDKGFRLICKNLN